MINKINFRRHENGLAVTVDGRILTPEKSLRVVNHSPTGFNIGYGGSGTAQLALAILLIFIPAEVATLLHQDFKWQFLADEKYDRENAGALEIDVRQWIEKTYDEKAITE